MIMSYAFCIESDAIKASGHNGKDQLKHAEEVTQDTHYQWTVNIAVDPAHD